MIILCCTADKSVPHWDGTRVLFTFIEDGMQMPCAISSAALEAITEGTGTGPAGLLKRFAGARLRIEALARDKLHARHFGISGPLNLWADDMDDLPPGGQSASGWLEAA